MRRYRRSSGVRWACAVRASQALSRLKMARAAENGLARNAKMAGLSRTPKLVSAPEADGGAYEAMIAAARALIPRLRDRAARTEELRHLPPETERDLHQAGLFRIVQPK